MRAITNAAGFATPVFLAMVGFAAASVLLASHATAQLVANGDFEGGSYNDVTGVPPPDWVPTFWSKIETNVGADPDEESILGLWANNNGPSAPGIYSLNWDRWTSDDQGDWTAIEQSLSISVPCGGAWLSVDIMVYYSSLPGGGWTSEKWEYPVTVVIWFTDTNGDNRYLQYGWYEWSDADPPGPEPPNGYVLPDGSGIVYSKQVPRHLWYAESFDLLALMRPLAEPQTITKIRVGGCGLDFGGWADNVAISVGGPSTVEGTSWGSIKSLYRE